MVVVPNRPIAASAAVTFAPAIAFPPTVETLPAIAPVSTVWAITSWKLTNPSKTMRQKEENKDALPLVELHKKLLFLLAKEISGFLRPPSGLMGVNILTIKANSKFDNV